MQRASKRRLGWRQATELCLLCVFLLHCAETPTRLRIERLDAGEPRPDVSSQIELAATNLDRMTTLWVDQYLAGLQRLPENTFPPIRPSGDEAGGLAGQQGVITRFRLAAEEALVVEFPASDAVYQSIQLGDAWFTTPDPRRFLSSRNLSQAEVDADGRVRFVISERDPGVANWLETGGAREGYVIVRSQGIRTAIIQRARPSAVRVALADLDRHLPAGTRRVGIEDRRLQTARRAQVPAFKR